MKLKKFNPDNSEQLRIGQSTIRLHKEGRISLSKRLIDIMKLNEGDKIELAIDEESKNPNTPDWYILKSDNGFITRKHSGNSSYHTFNSAFVANTFIKSLNKKNMSSIGCIVSEEPVLIDGVKYWAIITSSAR